MFQLQESIISHNTDACIMFYSHQKVLLASKHKKEQAIAQPFWEKLSCTLCVHDFDTDQFGTFTGEIPRSHTPYETCLLKAKTAALHHGYHLVVASEGSFGRDPWNPFVATDHEWMLFIDMKRNWVISEQLVSMKTNYGMMTIDQHTDISDFLSQVQFPSHALTLQNVSNHAVIAKGIHDEDTLEKVLAIAFKTQAQLLLGTDMRAMFNPTRMGVLRELAEQLVVRIARYCACCHAPGFGFKSTQGRLSCADCGAPTSFYKEEVWGCIQCDYQEYRGRKDGLLKVDPTYCHCCNP
jgi:hypothetical protein